MPNDIPLELIEKALALTGKTTEDMEEMYNAEYARDIDPDYRYRFSIEKFCYYLLSPEFIEKYVTQCEYPVYTDASIDHISKEF